MVSLSAPCSDTGAATDCAAGAGCALTSALGAGAEAAAGAAAGADEDSPSMVTKATPSDTFCPNAT